MLTEKEELKTDIMQSDIKNKPGTTTGKGKKWFIIGAVLFIIAGIASAYIYSVKSSKSIKTVDVINQEMKEIIDISGSVQSEHDIIIKAVSSGIIINRFVKDNTWVKLGTPLLEIDPQQTRLQLEQAKINVLANRLQAETSLANAQKTLFEAQARQKLNIENLVNQINKARSSVVFLEEELKRNISLLNEGAITAQSVDNQQQQLKQAKIDLKTANDNLEKVKKDKGEIVAAQNALSQSETVLNNTIKQGKASISIASDSLQRTTINAPFNGTVILWQANQGDYVVPGTPLGKFQDLNDIRLNLPVNELDLPKINTKNQVEIVFDAYPQKKYVGKIVWIGQSTISDNQNVQSFPVKVKFANPGNLIKPGMSGDAQIIVSDRKDVLAIPLSSIHKKDTRILVNILQNNEIKEVEIKPGLTTIDSLEVKSGLKAGDKVVIEESK